MKELDDKEGWVPKDWCFKLWCWRKLLRVSWKARISNQWILKEINPDYSLEKLMLKLKLQYLGHLMWGADTLRRDLDAGKDSRQEEKGMTEDGMVRWHHWLNGPEFEQTLGDGEGQGSLVSMGLQRVRHDWATEQRQPSYPSNSYCSDFYSQKHKKSSN